MAIKIYHRALGKPEAAEAHTKGAHQTTNSAKCHYIS